MALTMLTRIELGAKLFGTLVGLRGGLHTVVERADTGCRLRSRAAIQLPGQ
jgi:hypothetical protein